MGSQLVNIITSFDLYIQSGLEVNFHLGQSAMNPSSSERADLYYAQTYDACVSGWPGELDFYRAVAGEARSRSYPVLEVACGTGRVAIPLAQDGAQVVGLDRSTAMLEVARVKSAVLADIRWVEGDMRSFDLGETFGLAIIPGHSFQNINTPTDQLSCLQSIRRHLVPGGVLVVHLDHPELDWLAEIAGGKGGLFEPAGEFVHPLTGRRVRTSQAWSYQRSTQTAILRTRWEELDATGQVVERVDRGPNRLHCVFRFEMEHLLALAGYQLEAVYGDFFRGELTDQSEGMVWVASNPSDS